ncbi:MAG: polyvinylalcohol dehydrogenase [Verrucomicrobia bacterium]|nr:MAG: polyvinylalcohol dehydrogenase [Verrucomicrobiota bacterium]
MQISLAQFRTTPAIAAILFSLGGVAAAATTDWPQWRGPEHNDLCSETGLLKDWPASGPPLVWKAKGLGDGYSAVVAVGDRLYTAGDKRESSFVLALNTADGKIVWSTKLGKVGAVGSPEFEGPRGTPTVSGDLVFVLGQWGDFACYKAAKGTEVWHKDLVKDFGGVRPYWGYAESPLADGKNVIVTAGGSDGAILALDQKTGDGVWRSKGFIDAPHYSSLAVSELGGVRQYVQMTPESVAGVAAADGKLLWKAPRKGRTAVIPSPICKNDFVYVTSGYGVGCNLFKVLSADKKFSADEVYANKVMVNHHGGVINLGDYVYGHSEGKGWTCQELKSGEAKWQEKEALGKGAIAYADGRFYLRSEAKGTMVLIEASPAGYKEHGRFEQPDRSQQKAWPHPVIANGKLYLRDQDTLLCYDVKGK